MELKQARLENNLTQRQCAEIFGVSLRTYVTYENDEAKRDTIKYKYMLEQLQKMSLTDEQHGVLSTERIEHVCAEVLDKYRVQFCYLFGSYAKGTATEKSDVDLLICLDEGGLTFFEIAEKLREGLKKKVDLLDTKQLGDNQQLITEILRDGIKIYG